MNKIVPFGAGILKPEIMLRQAQGEIEQLRRRVAAIERAAGELQHALDTSTKCFAAAVVQLGGRATITEDELEATYRFGLRRIDPATHARIFEAQRVLEAVPDPSATPPADVAG